MGSKCTKYTPVQSLAEVLCSDDQALNLTKLWQPHLPWNDKLLARTRFLCPVLERTDALKVLTKEMTRFSDKVLFLIVQLVQRESLQTLKELVKRDKETEAKWN